jgi:penicillin G amidase
LKRARTTTIFVLFFLFIAFTHVSILGAVNSNRGQRREVFSLQEASASQSNAGRITLAGLQNLVTIRRDERGIPYIEAGNENDLYFAQGYATAQDRLWQMDILRRTARGELAEIFGRAVLEEDRRRRTYGFTHVIERTLAGLQPAARAPLDAYARGVNAYIESLDANSLPPEFRILGYRPRPWAAGDSLVIGKLLFEVLSTTWQTDLMRAALADIPPALREQILPITSPLDVILVGNDRVHQRANTGMRNESPHRINAEVLREMESAMRATENSFLRAGFEFEQRAASNNWVVSGRRTATEKPLLANDPHLPAGAPSIWHLVHLTAAPNLRVAGVTAPGAPGVVIGHNERIAWGATNLGPDVQDLYRETFDPQNPRRYRTPEGWREAEVRREEIRVRRSPTDAATDTVIHEVTVTRHGPVILERAGERYALRWTAFDTNSTDHAAFYLINRARNWNEFRNALRTYGGPTQNFIYADAEGHIGYYGAGRIPIRRTGDGSTPYDGATDAGEWTRFIPFDELPNVYDPPSGIIVTANNRTVGNSYPHHLTHEWAAPYRARRIYDLLQANSRLTVDDFRRIQGDTYSIGGAEFAREAANLLSRAANNDAQTIETVRLLQAWDGRVSADSRAALLVAELRSAFRRRVLTHLLGEERARTFSWGNGAFNETLIRTRPAEFLPREFRSYEDLLRACLADARTVLAQRHGANETEWTWGRFAQVRFAHPLARVPFIGAPFVIQPFPQNGSGSAAGSTVNVGSSVSMRFIADTSNWNNSQQGIAPGQSGVPSSPHWSDQITDWRNVTPRPFPFTEQAVAGATRRTITLAPPER